MKELNDKELKHFGLVFGVVIVVIFGFYLPWLFEYKRQIWPYFAGGLFWISSFFALGILRQFYNVWMRIAHVINTIITHTLLAFVFYFLITPFGLIRRAKKMLSKKEEGSNTYRKVCESESSEHMKRIF